MVNHLLFGVTVSLADSEFVCNICIAYCLFSLNLKIISLGFQNVVTIDTLRESHPFLDVVDHNRRPKDSVSISGSDFKIMRHALCSHYPQYYTVHQLLSIFITVHD